MAEELGGPGVLAHGRGRLGAGLSGRNHFPTTAEARAGDTCSWAGGKSQVTWGGVGLEYSNWQETDSWAFCKGRESLNLRIREVLLLF